MEMLKRLDRLIRSYSNNVATDISSEYRAAWEELDRYIRLSEGETGGISPGERVPDVLGVDFNNLEVPVGSSLDLVRRSYRRLLAQYHPDLHARDPGKERAAAELTRHLTASYQRIQDHYQNRERR